MASPQLSFGGTSVVNPYENLINVLGKNGALAQNMVAGDEAKRLEQEQAYKSEMLGMQRVDQQMKLDARNELLAEKKAGNEYAKNLEGALSGNVVSTQDQAKLAAIGMDQTLSPEARSTKMNALLPQMTKSYESSPAAQLQILRGTTAVENINPQTRVALLKEAEAPLEKTMDRQLDFGNQQVLNKEKYANDLTLLNKREEIDQANWLKRTEWQQNRDDAKALLHATATKQADNQKKYDQALGLQESLVSMLSTDESPEAKKDLTRVKSVIADLDTPKTDMSKTGPDGKPKMFVLPVDAKLDAVKKLYDEIESKQKIRREDTKELKKDKEDAVTGYSAAAVGSLDQGDVISDMVKGLDPKQGSILKAKYGTTEDAGAFMSDLYDKIPTNLRTELKSILKAKDDDTFLFTSKEDLLGKFVQKPEVRKALLGETPQVRKGSGNDKNLYKGRDTIFGAD